MQHVAIFTLLDYQGALVERPLDQYYNVDLVCSYVKLLVDMAENRRH